MRILFFRYPSMSREIRSSPTLRFRTAIFATTILTESWITSYLMGHTMPHRFIDRIVDKYMIDSYQPKILTILS